MKEIVYVGRGVILSSTCRQVLDGSRIKLWTDKWIPSSLDHLLMPKPGVEVNVDEKVETSINTTTCVWNENAIDRQVDVMDACLIKAMPLGDGNEADRMVGPFNRDGRFTVKSGDNLLISASLSSQTNRPSGSWHLEKCQCAVVFEGVQVCLRKTLSAVESMISEFMQVQSECVVNMNDNDDVVGAAEARWSAPPHAYCKVNVDASWEGGRCGTRPASSAIKAEAHAALSGVHLAAQMGISHVIFESDSKELVQCVKGQIQKGRWTIFPILAASRRSYSKFSWNWVHRGANKAANAAARRARRRMCDKVWESSLSSSLVFVLQAVGLACPPTM
ncbi:unnamed protein product [Prunus armeniaca]